MLVFFVFFGFEGKIKKGDHLFMFFSLFFGRGNGLGFLSPPVEKIE